MGQGAFKTPPWPRVAAMGHAVITSTAVQQAGWLLGNRATHAIRGPWQLARALHD